MARISAAVVLMGLTMACGSRDASRAQSQIAPDPTAELTAEARESAKQCVQMSAWFQKPVLKDLAAAVDPKFIDADRLHIPGSIAMERGFLDFASIFAPAYVRGGTIDDANINFGGAKKDARAPIVKASQGYDPAKRLWSAMSLAKEELKDGIRTRTSAQGLVSCANHESEAFVTCSITGFWQGEFGTAPCAPPR
jgi:hypothetical protein